LNSKYKIFKYEISNGEKFEDAKIQKGKICEHSKKGFEIDSKIEKMKSSGNRKLKIQKPEQ